VLEGEEIECVGKVKSDGLPIRQAPQIYRKKQMMESGLNSVN
jgi:hypothetical protein